MRRTDPRPALFAALLVLGVSGAGAEPRTVLSARPGGAWIEVRLAGRSGEVGLLVPATPACAQLVRPEGRVEWVERGFPGELRGEAGTCVARGILGLERWRDRGPRAAGRPRPTATARYTLTWRDGRRAALRGRFPLAARVGVAGGFDLVAWVADDADCAPILARSEATLEFRDSGRPALRLLAGAGRCTVLGLATPIEPPADGP